MVLYFIIREMMNKNNVPYLIAGALATATLLASGVFAAAPYIGFLAPVAALSVGLPFIIGYAVFSVVTIALSYKAISENKTNSELKNKMKAQEQTISGQKTQLAKKEEEENSKLKNKVEAQEEENSKLKDQVRTQKQKSSEQKTQLAEKK
jgi:membrane protein implicated in regulation of membrane protease activity